MAMTAQQKAENKAAAKVRDRAYRERYQAMTKAVEAAGELPDVVEAHRAYTEADERANAYSQARNAKEEDLRRQIEALEAQIRMLKDDPEQQRLYDERRTKATAWHSLKQSRMAEAEAAFPDLQGPARHSAAGWQPPAEVLQAMEAARKAATAD
jgi:hypothetical protein